MIRIILSSVLVVLFLFPILTAAIAPALVLGGNGAIAAASGGDDDSWDYWDWCVFWWTTHLPDWPD